MVCDAAGTPCRLGALVRARTGLRRASRPPRSPRRRIAARTIRTKRSGSRSKARSWLSENKWADAAIALNKGLAKHSRFRCWPPQSTQRLQNAGKHDRGERRSPTSGSSEHPNDPTLQAAVAQQMLAAKNYPGAIAKYRACSAISPEIRLRSTTSRGCWRDRRSKGARNRRARVSARAVQPNVVDTLGWTLVQQRRHRSRHAVAAPRVQPRSRRQRDSHCISVARSSSRATRKARRRALSRCTKLDAGAPLVPTPKKALAGNLTARRAAHSPCRCPMLETTP